jgi:preprotein translocase subunit SecF
MDIVGRRNWYFLLSLAIILPGIISMAVFGFRLGIDFAGGDQYNLAFTRPVQATAVQKEMDTFNVEATVQQAGSNGVLIPPSRSPRRRRPRSAPTLRRNSRSTRPGRATRRWAPPSRGSWSWVRVA